jgi:hypothetical protein
VALEDQLHLLLPALMRLVTASGVSVCGSGVLRKIHMWVMVVMVVVVLNVCLSTIMIFFLGILKLTLNCIKHISCGLVAEGCFTGHMARQKSTAKVTHSQTHIYCRPLARFLNNV